jgi:hypothetical protein
MRDIRNLLHEADPLRVESEPSTSDRSLRRQAVVAAAANATQSATKSRSRIPIYLSIMLIATAAFVIGSRLWSPFINHVQAAVRFEVKLAEHNPAPGLKEAKVAGSKQLVYLHNEVVVTNADIAKAEVIPHETQYWIGVTLTPAGARKMHAATQRHIDKPMAILIDGEVITAPIVRDTISDSAVINGKITKEEAERIVAGIQIH